jgi:hypothetical protein
MLIRTIGLFWREDHVFWGAGSKPGSLLGVPSNYKTGAPVDFRDQIGIYVLYSGYQIIYVGQAGRGNQRFFDRLKQHRTDDLAARWNRFSWFGVRGVTQTCELTAVPKKRHPELGNVLNHIEAILIHSVEPPLNRQSGRFGDKVTRYLQVRDERLGPTHEEIILKLGSFLNRNDEQKK